MLRERTGGFHCDNFMTCYLASNLVYLFIVIAEPYIWAWNNYGKFCLGISAVIIFWTGTVNHPNMSYDADEMKKSKWRSRCILGIELMTIFVFDGMGGDDACISYMSFGIILCSVLIVMAKIFNQEMGDGRKEDGEDAA